ncbi:hypothetical protein [Nocardioides pantholopis]|uniref:hypothetical protein n=1 Tax=Nocardioides pantholopis TaxID=2483798 RepID=UPI000F08A1BC|nr:hypothetical protein [Nocardioides pantholopis]
MTDVRDSTPNSSGPERAQGEMGVSSERVGPTGPGQVSTDGVRDVAPVEPDGDTPPEQSADGAGEDNPTGLQPKAGYPSRDPRSAQNPYEPS